jgi:hypothetical protein
LPHDPDWRWIDRLTSEGTQEFSTLTHR